MISLVQLALGGLAPPILAAYVALAGQAPLAVQVDEQVVTSGGGFSHKEPQKSFKLAPQHKAPEPRRIAEPQLARTELDRLLAELLQARPTYQQVQVPVSLDWVAEWRRIAIEPADEVPAAPTVVVKGVIETLAKPAAPLATEALVEARHRGPPSEEVSVRRWAAT